MIVRSVVLLNFAIFASSSLFGSAEEQDIACSGSRYSVLSASSGTIQSPGFPNRYPSPSDCRWNIKVPQGKRIRLVFRSFEIEAHTACNYDYLQIRDGGSTSSQSMGKFCGKANPGPLLTSGNKALVSFKSDTSVASKGFKLQWSLYSTPAVSRITTDAGELGVTTAPTTAGVTTATTTVGVTTATTTTTAGVTTATTTTTAGVTTATTTTTAGVTTATTTTTAGVTTATTTLTTATSGNPTTVATKSTSEPVVQTSGRPATTTSAIQRPGTVAATIDGARGGSSRVTSVGLLATTWLTSSTKRPDFVTAAASWNNLTMNTEDYMENIICYVCEGMSPACLTGEGLEDSAAECSDDEACWVERLEAREEAGAVYYRRSCQPKCADYWREEICMTANGQGKVCRVCCTEDRCNTHILTGHTAAQSPRPDRGATGTGTTVASLQLVSILALTVCLDILAMAA